MVVVIILVIAAAVVIAVPVIPSKPASYTSTSQTATGLPATTPPYTWCESDPTGSRCGGSFANGTYTMSLSTYNSMLHDPYQHFCSNDTRIAGDTIYLTCPQTNIVSGLSSSTSVNGFESLSCWLIGRGGLYYDGRYIWR
jgi:hypothetical protein